MRGCLISSVCGERVQVCNTRNGVDAGTQASVLGEDTVWMIVGTYVFMVEEGGAVSSSLGAEGRNAHSHQR